MKKFLKILGIIVGVIVLLLVIAAVTINIKGIPSYETQPVSVTIESDSASLANGERLVTMLCSGCHLSKKSRVLEGGEMTDIPAEFGKVFAPNITRHPEKGLITKYTDGELVFLLRTGIKRDGKYAPPWMVKLPHMANDDMEDVIAFLRSDHPITAPSETVQPPCEPSFLVKMLSYFAFKPYPMPTERIERPDTTNKLAVGKYFADAVLHCFECHSADFKTNNTYFPEQSVGFYAGGNKMLDLDKKLIYTANITMDEKTGIGTWTEDDFVKAVRFGSRPDGSPMMWPMEKFSLLTDEEVRGIYAYLKTVPVIANDVKALPKE